MKNTYTYTARSIEDPNKVVTFTLHEDRMSVDIGAPMEQITQVLTDEAAEEEQAQEPRARLWLKPLAVSLVERGTAPLRITDIATTVDEDHLSVKSWVRLGGLRLSRITLMAGRIDNPAAAAAFVNEVHARKSELTTSLPFLNILNYWGTWLAAAVSMMTLFIFWQRHAAAEQAA